MTTPDPEWRIEPGLLGYAEAVAAMEARVAAIGTGSARELIWLVEHPPLYTAGTSADIADLLDPHRFPVFETGRGGRHTYHGPGQRVVYVLIDLGRRGRDVRRFIAALESWIIAALSDLGIAARVIPGKVGVWVDGPSGPAKIAAIGVRLRRWVSFHGLAINVTPDLGHFSGIRPCGLDDPVISLESMRKTADMAAVDAALMRHLRAFLGSLTGGTVAPPITSSHGCHDRA